MSGLKLYRAGYHDLVSVVPPDGELAPTTGLQLDARGKAPGRPRRDGRWVGYAFLQEEGPDEQDVRLWDEDWEANIGLLGEKFPGLDIDVDDPQLSTLVVQEATRLLGPAAVRTSRDPRRLLVYRTDEPFARMACEIEWKGESHVLEMLGVGRQYLVYGRHPSGVDYGWEGKPLWEWEPTNLTSVSKELVQEFFEHLQELLHERAEVRIAGDGRTKSDKAPPQDTLRAPSIQELKALVEQIPNNYPDRDSYIRFGHAVKAAAGPEWEGEGLDIFMEWADRWEDGHNEPRVVEADWSRMHPPFRVGWRYIQEVAREKTDYEPATDEFDSDPEAEPGKDELAVPGLQAYTDSWVVEQLARRLAGRVRYVPESGRWHVWGELEGG